VGPNTKPAFALWITGLPASGKSTLAAAIASQVREHGVDVAVLESDELRKIFTPDPHYGHKERDTFYRQMAYVGLLLATHGVPVIFDATANRRAYRDWARQQIPKFIEVYVDSPLEVCKVRDPKGIYHDAATNESNTVPGLATMYEPPEYPELIVHGDRELPVSAAKRVLDVLIEKGYLRGPSTHVCPPR